MSGRKYLSSDHFADEVNKLSPPWDGTWSIKRYLEAFDESGEFRPLYRIRLPERAIHYQAQKEGLEPLVALNEREREEFQHLRYALDDLAHYGDDPETPTALEQPPEELAPFISRVTHGEQVSWKEWRLRVGGSDQDPYTRDLVRSYYAPWQILRFWALIEQYSLRAFLDPRRMHPRRVFDRDWDRDLNDRVMTWTVGHPRLAVLATELERDGWLARLYQSREVIADGQLRVDDPALNDWKEGRAMSADERPQAETQRVRERCESLAQPWLAQPDGYYGQVRALLELWYHAHELEGRKLARAIEEDLWAAISWAGFAFGTSFDDLDKSVGTADPGRRVTLVSVLKPTWYQARRRAERGLNEYAEAFNKTIQPIQLGADDPKRYLDFLTETGLDAWMLDFSSWVEEFQDPTDTAFDRRSLHLRSLALLHEQILGSLAEQHGTPSDQERVRSRWLKDSLKAFLADRRGDWRALAWQHIKNNYKLTETTGGVTLFARLDEIAAVRAEPRVVGVVQTVLALAAVRNYGSHRFTRETDQMRAHRGQMMRAVVFAPLLYWKIATTLG